MGYSHLRTKPSRGFTLIELLVVIAIIGILASIILASLAGAHNKGTAASVKEEMDSTRNAAELYYVSHNYSFGTAGGTAGSCATSGQSTLFADSASNMENLIAGITGTTGVTADCGDSRSAWSVAAQLPDGTYWCVDSSGASRGATASGTTYTGLIGASPDAHATAGATACQ